MENESILVSVVETQTFESDASECMSEEEVNEFICHIAANPELGVVIKGTGGIRKVRWAIQNRGKKWRSDYLLFSRLEYAVVSPGSLKKNEKQDLSAEEKKLLRKLSEELVNNYRPKEESEK